MKKLKILIFSLLMVIPVVYGANSKVVASADNLLLNKAVEYSGVEGGKTDSGNWQHPHLAGESVVDGDSETRWSADKEDDQWIIIDMGEEKNINQITLDFHAESPEYEVFVSTDGETYESVYIEEEGSQGTEKTVYIELIDKTVRYVKYQQHKMWQHSSNGQSYGSSLYEIEAYETFKAENIDLLFNKEVEYSGVEGGKTDSENWRYPQFAGENVVDGDSETRWSADKEDDQWIIVDMGAERYINEIVLDFHAESPEYEVLISTDNENYESIYKEENGSQGNPNTLYIDVDNKPARYVKYQQHKMWRHSSNGQNYGSSLYAIEAYVNKRLPEKINIEAEHVLLSLGRSSQLEYSLEPEGVDISPDRIVWHSDNEDIATVNQEGVVQAQGLGESVITATIQGTDISTSISVEVIEEKYQYSLMRERWRERLIGNVEINDDADIQAYREQISDNSMELWDKLNTSENRTYLWERIPTDTTSADYTTQFNNIKKLALGYYEPSSELYQNKEVYEEILNAIDFMIDEKNYNGSYWTGNWWDWQIGSPQPLIDTLILLHDDLLEQDYEKLEKFVNPVKGYANDPKRQWPSYRATGANLTDIAISVLGSAILLEDDSRIELVTESVPEVLVNVTRGDGLYKDGSLVQHTFFPYNGSYGNELLKGVGRIQSILYDTDWEINDSNMTNLFNVIDKGYLQLMTHGKMPSMFSGRSISRAPGTNPFTSEFESGKETIANLTLISKFAPEELKTKIDSYVKQWVLDVDGYFNFYNQPRDFEAIVDLKDIMNNQDVVAHEDRSITNVYGSMDRVFQKNNDYSVGISMYSSRIANYEFGNTENKRGWHTADGMLYLYNNDLAQFDEGYWVTIDSKRLPGTTVDTKALADGANQSTRSPQSWVGGSTNGELGAIGMYLDKTNTGMSLTAKKSWFLLDGYIVNLGADINGTTDATIETILENRLIDPKHTDIQQGNTNGENYQWININGSDNLNNMGYVIPNTMGEIEIETETRSGEYLDINGYFVNDKAYTNDFVKIVKNHGQSVEDETYEYMIVPGKTDQEMVQLAESIPYQMISNTDSIQAIQHQNVLMANVWENNQEIEGILIETPMSLIVDEQEDNEYKITMSNPAHGNLNLVLSFEREIKQVIEQDEEFSVDSNTITLNTNGLQGASRTITIELEALPVEEVDKTDLRELVEAHADKQEEGYTADSWEVFAEAISNAEAVLADEEATQEEVNQALENLQTALDQLEEKEVEPDKSALVELIEIAEKLTESDYTESSYADLIAALDAAQTVLADEEATQEEVNQALENLQTALDQLEEKEVEVNKSILADLVETVEKLTESDYTETSYADLAEALEAAQTILANEEATQEEVDQAVIALQEAVDQLEQIDPETVDKSKLKVLVALHANKQEEDFTIDSWEVFVEALRNAESVLADDEVTQEEVDQALENLQTAIDQLEEKVDQSALVALVKEAEKLDETDYTEASYADLVEALKAAQMILDADEVTQEEVDQALENLQTALDQLEEKADKSDLIDLVEAVEELEEANYTEESYADLVEALEAAQKILADEEVTQEEVDQTLENLQTALDQLEEKVNKTALVDLVEKAEKLDRNDYTEVSYAKLSEALEAAQKILTDDEATQEEVDAAFVTLEQAIEDLETLQSDSDSDLEKPERPKPTDPKDPSPTEPEDGSPVVDKGNDGDSLPATATSTYNWLLIGFTLLLVSGLILLVTNRKKKSIE
ncbi:polysaccharide lyase family 8 super-sandwich domain-containing protein [Amphibacillus sp. Q70]|uniref:polysaccharide lyase family 8 super-sandwich domain-containing protein n=1 Tax=Amphibacillus sp. Q70 TaxID=3453416 RepID=UPI003F8340C6